MPQYSVPYACRSRQEPEKKHPFTTRFVALFYPVRKFVETISLFLSLSLFFSASEIYSLHEEDDMRTIDLSNPLVRTRFHYAKSKENYKRSGYNWTAYGRRMRKKAQFKITTLSRAFLSSLLLLLLLLLPPRSGRHLALVYDQWNDTGRIYILIPVRETRLLARKAKPRRILRERVTTRLAFSLSLSLSLFFIYRFSTKRLSVSRIQIRSRRRTVLSPFDLHSRSNFEYGCSIRPVSVLNYCRADLDRDSIRGRIERIEKNRRQLYE